MAGIVLAAVPLFLWIAWTPVVFAVVLLAGVAGAALLIALIDHGHSESADAQVAEREGPTAAAPDQFFEAIHRISPLNYHHSRRGKTRFHRAMEKLRNMIR